MILFTPINALIVLGICFGFAGLSLWLCTRSKHKQITFDDIIKQQKNGDVK